MSRELLKQALDALDAITDKIDGTGFSSSNEFSHCLDTIDALRAALAQPQAEPVAEVRAKSDDYGGTFVQWYSLPVAGMKLYATPQQAQPPAPDGWVMVPDYRGYAALGTGQYLLDISGDANPAELIIHIATGEEKDGRTVGDLRDKSNPGEMIQPEKMAVRLAFFTVAGLDALEQQLRILRETHFAAAPAAPAVPDGVPDTSLVICPNCCTQFRAIPQDVQRLMIDAGFEPPFVAASVVREPIIDEMDAVASKYAHKLALDLECVLSDYNGKWWDTAMQTIGEYRMAMNRIHERESPTHMGEPALPKRGITGGDT